MNRNDFIKKQRGGIKGLLFPHSINRTELLIRAVIIGLCVGIPLRMLSKTFESNIVTLSLDSIALFAEVDMENPNLEKVNEMMPQLEIIQDEIKFNNTLQLAVIALSLALYALSFWIMFIPRLRSMGQSPKLAWLMAIPVVNVVFAWFLIFAPPK